MPSIEKKPLSWKKNKKHYLYSNQKLASTQILGSAFLDRFRKAQNSKYESDLFKVFDCIIGCHGSVHSDYISFVIKQSIVFKCVLNNFQPMNL